MIYIEEISSKEQIDVFWQQHIKYLVDEEIITDEEEKAYFASREYRDVIEAHMLRTPDTHHMVYFVRNGRRIGATQYCTYKSEDGKCFILDFWVFPEFRGKGTGHRCFDALKRHTQSDGAMYYELNVVKENARRFWQDNGFVDNGIDEYGVTLMIAKRGN